MTYVIPLNNQSHEAVNLAKKAVNGHGLRQVSLTWNEATECYQVTVVKEIKRLKKPQSKLTQWLNGLNKTLTLKKLFN